MSPRTKFVASETTDFALMKPERIASRPVIPNAARTRTAATGVFVSSPRTTSAIAPAMHAMEIHVRVRTTTPAPSHAGATSR
jgi:hypothetical protein